MSNVLFVPGDKQFVCSPGDNHFSKQERGGGQTFLHTVERQKFYVGGGGGYDNVDKEMDVTETRLRIFSCIALAVNGIFFLAQIDFMNMERARASFYTKWRLS